MIELKNVSYSYSTELDIAINNVSLTIRNGCRIGIVGPNGAGKTTLMLLLAGLFGIKEIAGEILMEKKPVLTKKEMKELKNKTGIVFQSPDDQFIGNTVEDDIAFSYFNNPSNIKREAILEKTEKMLSLVHLEELAKKSPFELSFGERKRCALAGVLARHPDFLLLDEPTMGLDLRERKQLISIIKKYEKGVIVATHDLTVIKELSEYIIVLIQGSIVYSGAASDLFKKNESVLEKYELL